jgi:hypothetical protein
VSIHNPLELDLGQSPKCWDDEYLSAISNYINSKIILEVYEEAQRDPFAETRAKNGIRLEFHPETIDSCRRLLSFAPPAWERIQPGAVMESLTRVIEKASHFSPLWLLLEREARREGRGQEADAFRKQFLEARKMELAH